MSEPLLWVYPVVVVLVAYLVLGITGFGSALVVVPLLAWQWPLAEAVTLALLLDVPAALLMGRLNLKLVRWVDLRQLVPGMLLGCGLWLFRQAPSAWPLLVLGLCVVWVGLRALRQSPLLKAVLPASPWVGALYGMGVGMVQVSFGTSGPLVLAWLARRRVPAQAVRASTPVMMLLSGVVALLLFTAEGRLSAPLVWQRLLVLLPVAFAAVLLGHAVAARWPAERLRRVICMLLVCSGALLVFNAGRQLL
jgi:uncharacterized membrane protein YfcA